MYGDTVNGWVKKFMQLCTLHMYVVRKYSGLFVMYCIVCRHNPSFSLHSEYAEGAQLNTTPLVRAVAHDVKIN